MKVKIKNLQLNPFRDIAELEARLTMDVGQLLDQAISVMADKGKEFCSYCVNFYWAPGSEKTRGLEEMRGVMQSNWHRTGKVIGEVRRFLKDRRDEILASLMSEKNNKGGKK